MSVRALIIDDSPYKAHDIEQALKEVDILDIAWVKDLERAKKCLMKNTYDVIMLDMYFPKVEGGREFPMCGMLLLSFMREQGIDTPVIVCSTANILINEEPVIDCIKYSDVYEFQCAIKITLKAYEIIE